MTRKIEPILEQKIINLYNEGYSAPKIAKMCCVYQITVYNILKRNNVIRRKQTSSILLKQQAKMCNMYIAGHSVPEIAHKYNLYDTIVFDVLHRHHIITRTPIQAAAKRVKNVNHEFFKSPLSEKSAYLIGFIMADGSVLEAKNGVKKLSITLKQSDKHFLNTIKKLMCSDYAISDGEIHRPEGCYKTSTFCVRSEQIVNDLAQYGVVPRKSLIAEAGGGIELNPHFWRGVIDGDGSIFVNKGNNQATISLVGGSLKLMTQWQMFIKQLLPNNHAAILYRGKERNCYTFAVVGNNQAPQLIKHLYENCSIALPRKYQKAMRIINNYNNRNNANNATL